ncbi:MAG: hypothetical protein MUF10_00280 [Thermoanaerobaculaceae bacterium]|jgi:hypothetical protein|nr:hypothetical protein [Thermoanaerobaculaceae bacterium]
MIASYHVAVLALLHAGLLVPGETYDIEVLHDDDCSLLVRRGTCDCEPEIRVREVHRAVC